MNKALYDKLASIILKETGILYREDDYFRLTSRISKILELNDLESESDLLAILETDLDSKFMDQIIDIATNNESSFFRDKKPFDLLKEELLPFFKSKNSVNLKIWSAACSSGQEPLSILMTILNSEFQSAFSIDASDISRTILEKSSQGIYSNLEVQRGLPIKELIKYFEKHNESKWKVKNTYLSKINYFFHNLISSTPLMSKYDVIFCRNILIYQSLDNRVLILKKLFNSLAPDGVLVLGSGESLSGVKNEFILNKGKNYNFYAKQKIDMSIVNENEMKRKII